MKNILKFIVDKAKRLGACNLLDEAKTLQELHILQHSPQGREFCQEKNFPDYETWEKIKEEIHPEMVDTFIDAGKIIISDKHKVTVVGKTNAIINCSGPQECFFIHVQHGASVLINAGNYAVLVITNIGRNNHIQLNKDNTVRVL